MAKRLLVPAIGDEFKGAQLGDERRSKRLVRVAKRLASDPAKSFPRSLESEAELEGFYRFINNDAFSSAAVLAPHIANTFERAAEAGSVLAIHDTTTIEFTDYSPREGLGRTTPGCRQGFYAHTSLLVSEAGLPLGVGHLETYSRAGKPKHVKRPTTRARALNTERESLRWLRAVESIESAKEPGSTIIHVTDAEGDFYELLSKCIELKTRFVIRAAQLNRIVTADAAPESMAVALADLPPTFYRDIDLSERKFRARLVPRDQLRKHPPRAARTARVGIAARTIRVNKTRSSSSQMPSIEINVVRVWEANPPTGDKPIEWVLLTTEPIESRQALERIVDIYRTRWLIEEFFKALKTGCSLEQRQVESYEGLRDVLALFIPIAYRMLFLRALHRLSPEGRARALFSGVEIQLLQGAESNVGLPPIVTLDDELRHLARLGGHLKRNGDPGWQTLGRGYEKLLMLYAGWKIAMNSRLTCDQ